MKKWLAAMLSLMIIMTATGCDPVDTFYSLTSKTTHKKTETKKVSNGRDFKVRVGFLFPSDISSPDSKARMEAARTMQNKLGLSDKQVLYKEKVTKKNCVESAMSLIESGCTIIFSIDPAFEGKIVELAKEQTMVQFCQEGGEQAKESKLPNLHNYYSRIFEAYYVSGICAGLKLNELEKSREVETDRVNVGFVAAQEDARSISCLSAFYLGVKSVNEGARMYVRYVGSEGKYDDDGQCAKQLALAGVAVMGYCTRTTAVPTVCAEHDIPVVGCESGIIDVAPEEGITSAVTDWSSYYTYAVEAVMNETEFETDWCAGYKEGAVSISQLNDPILTEGTVTAVADAEKELRNGKQKVFDCENILVEEEQLDSAVERQKYKAYAGYIEDGVFLESTRNSAPAFDLLMDGIEISDYDYIAAKEEEQKAMEDATREDSDED